MRHDIKKNRPAPLHLISLVFHVFPCLYMNAPPLPLAKDQRLTQRFRRAWIWTNASNASHLTQSGRCAVDIEVEYEKQSGGNHFALRALEECRPQWFPNSILFKHCSVLLLAPTIMVAFELRRGSRGLWNPRFPFFILCVFFSSPRIDAEKTTEGVG